MKRGITQVDDIDGAVTLLARKANGRIAFKLTVAPDDWDARMASRLEKWLDAVDPPLRLVPGGSE